MKLAVTQFQGEAPITADRLLGPGMASSAVNAKLVSGDLDSFADFGNAFTLAKTAPIEALWLMQGPAPSYWLQFGEGEVAYGSGIDVALGTIPGDSTYRTFITGLAGGPRQTNLFYATDPSQRGGSAVGAYPYQTFPLGLDSPQIGPTASAPSAPTGPTTSYEFAQAASINQARVVNGGSGYRVGDQLQVEGGTLMNRLEGAVVEVTEVDGSGAVTGLSLMQAGFYQAGGTPASPAGVSGGQGSGCILTLTPATISFNGWFPVSTGGASNNHWSLTSDSWRISWGHTQLQVCYSTGAFGFKTAGSWTFQADAMSDFNGSTNPDLVLYLPGAATGGVYNKGPALAASVVDGRFTLFSDITNGGSQPETGFMAGTIVDDATGLAIPGATWLRITVSGTAQTNSTTPGFAVTATIALQSDPANIIGSLAGFIPYVGESLGVGGKHRGNYSDGDVAEYQNVLVTVSEPAGEATSVATSYVYTYVSAFGSGDNAITQESGPSDPSATIVYFLDGSTNPVTMSPVTVTIPAAPPGQNITEVDVYRLSQAGSYQLVRQFTSGLDATMSFVDQTLDEDLQDVLLSTDWLPPPEDLQGIVSLPNGRMAGFSGNTLYISEQNLPFAWTLANQFPTDYPIVGIAAIDTTVLVLTQANPYTAWGSDTYTMSKERAFQGCTSKRSIATHKRLGVIYASGNGLSCYAGQGQVDLIRMPDGRPYFSVEQWQALNPGSVFGLVHDDRYWFWYTRADGSKGGYCLDLSPASFGLVELDFHAMAGFVDPRSDTMYLVLDQSAYPVGGAAVGGAQNLVWQWEAGPGQRPRTWLRREAMLPRPTAFMLARVRAEDYADIRLTLSCRDEASGMDMVAFDGTVPAAAPFLVAPKVGVRWSLGLGGSSRVNSVELAEAADELAQ